MSDTREEFGLTPDERSQAREFWDALMFAPTSYKLDLARLDLAKAPAPVQHAVMSSITQMWLDEYEPQRDENPFSDDTPSLSEQETMEVEQVQEEMVQEHQQQTLYDERERKQSTHSVKIWAASLLHSVHRFNSPLWGRSSANA